MILERKMAVLFNKKYSHLAFRPCDCNWNYAGHAMGEKSANARWLLHPIFNNQAMHTLELSDVVCDQNHIFRSGVRGDHHIQWANRRTSILQVGSNFAVSCCTMLRGFIDRKNSCRSITARTIGAAGGYRHSLSNRG